MASRSEKTPRVVVAMSGGVDSSVAAALLAERGYEVIGVTMRLFDAPFEGAGRLSKSCCSLEDVEDARATCRKIGARHYYMNFEKEFQAHVIDYFVGEYERGRTPYPCLACNDRLKFDFLMRRAEFLDADYVATGHYAQVLPPADSPSPLTGEGWGEGDERAIRESPLRLARAVDPVKDQSYVLYKLTQSQMTRLLLPVGSFTKDGIREYARSRGLPVADKPDSQDICFIPAGNYREFIEPRLSRARPGPIVDTDGRKLGEHDGVHRFTIGQRKGLPLPGGAGRPVYVTEINAETGVVTVGPADALARRELYASGVNWVSGRAPSGPVRVHARVRYRGAEDEATVTPAGGWAKIEFDRPMRAVTPGQAVVFYRDDEVLGGGTIELSAPARSAAPDVAAAD